MPAEETPSLPSVRFAYNRASMARVYDQLNDKLIRFIEEQQMFFVGTAPSGPQGHINISPKGLDSFRVLGPSEAAYIDFVGSGVETIAHIRDNGRLCIMFCAFSGSPNIVRLYGNARVVEPGDPDFAELRTNFGEHDAGVRSIIVLNLTRISDACGYGVPLYEYQGQRTTLTDWASKKGEQSLADYKREKNSQSIDGLPGLQRLDGIDSIDEA